MSGTWAYYCSSFSQWQQYLNKWILAISKGVTPCIYSGIQFETACKFFFFSSDSLVPGMVCHDLKVPYIYFTLSSVSKQPQNENASLKCEISLQYFVNSHLHRGNEAYRMPAPSPLSRHSTYSPPWQTVSPQCWGTTQVIYRRLEQAWEMPPTSQARCRRPRCRTIDAIVSPGSSIQHLEAS